MRTRGLSRREFLARTAAVAGGVMLSPLVAQAAAGATKRTAADQVTLGKTGLKLSRLGVGTGSKNGEVQRALGTDGFNRLIRYAYDKGLTYIDTADAYQTHPFVRDAIKGLPREKLFIQSKMMGDGTEEKPLAALDRFRKELGVEYIDSLLVHCTMEPDWDEQRKRVVEALQEAKAKKIIRAHGVSCHTLPALKRAVALDWVDVHLVRINPQGAVMDTEDMFSGDDPANVPPVMAQLKLMREKKRGVIGMKLIGDGNFVNPDDREKAIRFVMQADVTDAVVIGFGSTGEIDEAISRINNALAVKV